MCLRRLFWGEVGSWVASVEGTAALSAEVLVQRQDSVVA